MHGTNGSKGGNALAAWLGVLEQCRRFLAQVGPERYTRPSALIVGSTIGQHVRHSLDHFSTALASIEGGLIDYDRRERDTSIERELPAAAERLAEIATRLSHIRDRDVHRSVRVRVMLSVFGDEAVLTSTLGRELAFAAHHATHHHALMAAIARELGAPAAPEFGQAPSTLNHRHRLAPVPAGGGNA